MELGYSAEALTRTLCMLDLPYWMDETYLYTLFAGEIGLGARACICGLVQPFGQSIRQVSPHKRVADAGGCCSNRAACQRKSGAQQDHRDL